MFDAETASKALWEEFPELREKFEEYEGLLHLQFAALARRTEAAIAMGNLVAVRHDFMFVDRVLARANEFVDNAIHVSYLEHVDLSGEHGAAAEKLLSTRLREGWQEIHDYMNRVAELVSPPTKERSAPRRRKRR
jgi:hypothetical protein